MMPLSMAKPGEKVRIVRINGGTTFLSRIMNMGIVEGKIVRVLNNTRGPVLIAVDNFRIALGRGASFKIFVEYIKEGEDEL